MATQSGHRVCIAAMVFGPQDAGRLSFGVRNEAARAHHAIGDVAAWPWRQVRSNQLADNAWLYLPGLGKLIPSLSDELDLFYPSCAPWAGSMAKT